MGDGDSEQMGGGFLNVGFLASAAMGGVLDELVAPVTLNGVAFTLAAIGLLTDMADSSDGPPLCAPAVVECGLRWSSPTRGDATLLTLMDSVWRLTSG